MNALAMPFIPRSLLFIGIVTLCSYFEKALQMFDQIASQLAHGCTTSQASLSDFALGNKELLQQIISRLDQEVPAGPYVSDEWLAQALGIKQKTLINRRGDKPGRYPQPLHLAGGQVGRHARRDIVEWLAREEMLAKTRRVHKCN